MDLEEFQRTARLGVNRSREDRIRIYPEQRPLGFQEPVTGNCTAVETCRRVHEVDQHLHSRNSVQRPWASDCGRDPSQRLHLNLLWGGRLLLIIGGSGVLQLSHGQTKVLEGAHHSLARTTS